MADDDDLEAYVQKRGRAAYPWKRPPSSSQYKPGQSGNPGGLSSFYREGRKIAQRAAPEMMERLIELARTAKDERVRSVCIIGILDRAGPSADRLRCQPGHR